MNPDRPDLKQKDGVDPAIPLTLPPGGASANYLPVGNVASTTDCLAPKMSSTQASGSTVLPNMAIPGYEILRRLGQGGMGVVYQARDLALKRVVALKMMLEAGSATMDQLARFQVEAEAIAQLQHPHIVQIFTSGVHKGKPFFVMECVEGGDLAGKLQGQPQPFEDAARLVLLLARAMHAAHRKGILHRDLKPSNVLLAPPADEPALNTIYGCPKITDFGLAKDLYRTQVLTAGGMVLGTAKYMAPEQAEGDGEGASVGPPADVYALGSILYEMLTGQTPFLGSTFQVVLRQVLLAQPLPPAEIRAGIPPDLEAICLRCLAKKPADRYPSAAALAEDLERHLGQQPVQARPVVRRRRPRLAWILGSLGAACVVGVALWIWLANPFQSAPPDPLRPPAVAEAGSISKSNTFPELDPKALKGRFTIRLFSDENKAWFPIEDPESLPVHKGDLVQIDGSFDAPAYAYYLWLDTQGEVVPLYPWNPDEIVVTDYKLVPPAQTPKKQIRSPQGANRGWRFDDKPGLETLLMLARATPLPKELALASLLGPLPPTKIHSPREFAQLSLERGRERPIYELELSRGPEKKAREADDALVRLMGKLRGEFEIIRAVRFAHEKK